MKTIISHLKKRRTSLESQISKLNLAIKSLEAMGPGDIPTPFFRRPKFSKAARERIAAAQRARWRKIKAAKK